MSETAEKIKAIQESERSNLAKLSEKNGREFEIQETIYLGNLNGKDVYRLSEADPRDNYTAILYKYFDSTGRLQGIKNVRPDGLKEWIFLEEEWEQLRDEIDMNESRLEEELQAILDELGLSMEDIDSIQEVDLEQIIQEREEEESDKEPDEEEPEEDIETREENEEEERSEATSKYTNTLNEVDTDKYVDQKGTELGEALGLEEYGYTKLLIVHADNVRDIKDADGKHQSSATKRLAILGVKEQDGKRIVEKIPEDVLDYERGADAESVRFDDNAEVEKNAGTYERFVNPRTNKGISIEMSEMETKVYYQGGVDAGDNTAVMGRVEDGRTGWGETETREIFNYNHGEYQQDKVNEEMDTHDKDEGEEIQRENADGDLETVSGHLHEIDENSQIVYNGTLMPVSEVAQLSVFKISPEYFVELYNEKIKQFEGKEDFDIDEIYTEIEDDINEQVQGGPTR